MHDALLHSVLDAPLAFADSIVVHLAHGWYGPSASTEQRFKIRALGGGVEVVT